MKKIIAMIIIVCLLSVSISAYNGTSLSVPDGETIYTMFRKAEELCAWYSELGHFPWEYLDRDAAYQEPNLTWVEARTIIPVSNTEMNSAEKMDAYMHRYLSDEMIEKIRDKVKDSLFFTNDSGTFCYYEKAEADRYNTYRSSEKKFEITYSSSEKIVYTLTLENVYERPLDKGGSVDKLIRYDYILEKNSDGNWVFTNFIIPFELLVGSDYFGIGGNPYTSDCSLGIFTSAALLSAVGAGYVMKKRKLAS